MSVLYWSDGKPFAGGLSAADESAWGGGLPSSELDTGPAPSLISASLTVVGGLVGTLAAAALMSASLSATADISTDLNSPFATEATATADVTPPLLVVTQFASELSVSATVTGRLWSEARLESSMTAEGTMGALGLSVPGTWPRVVCLTPTVTDDGWMGELTYLWEQVSTGPATATILSPSSSSTCVLLPEVAGVYVFRLTVSRADDALVGSGLWRVTVYTSATIAEESNDGPVTLTVNDVPFEAKLNTTQISENLQAGTCSFTIAGVGINVGNKIILSRGGVRLFGGRCLQWTLTEEEKNVWSHITVDSFAWHLRRKTVTKDYSNTSITAIVLDLLAMAPGNITSDFVASGLPTADISFNGDTLDVALTRLAGLINAHWRVDHFERMHFAIQEVEDAPLALTALHPSMKNLSITKSLRQTVNRVQVDYDKVTTLSVLVDAEIQVEDLDGYSPAGGDTVIDGNAIHYNGIRQGPGANSVYGAVQVGLTSTAVTVDDPGLPSAHGYGYRLTLVTAEGETPPVATWSGTWIYSPENALELVLDYVLGDSTTIARVQRINIYRGTGGITIPGNGSPILVGSFLPVPGSRFTDFVAGEDFPESPGIPRYVYEPYINTADVTAYYLTGCSGSQDIHTPASVTVEDTAAQAALAVLLGGGDDGVIEATIQAGSISQAQAVILAQSFLDNVKDIAVSIACDVRDDKAVPGQTIAVNFPAPHDVSVDLKIQTLNITGFEKGIPHEHSITAAKEVQTIEALMLGL